MTDGVAEDEPRRAFFDRRLEERFSVGGLERTVSSVTKVAESSETASHRVAHEALEPGLIPCLGVHPNRRRAEEHLGLDGHTRPLGDPMTGRMSLVRCAGGLQVSPSSRMVSTMAVLRPQRGPAG